MVASVIPFIPSCNDNHDAMIVGLLDRAAVKVEMPGLPIDIDITEGRPLAMAWLMTQSMPATALPSVPNPRSQELAPR